MTVNVHLLHVAGARPNFMKVAAVMAAVDRWNTGDAASSPGARPVDDGVHFSQTLVHTGQHYDADMSDVFFRELGLPEPEHHLGVGSGSHAQQTAQVLLRLEPVLETQQPDLAVVVGDVNSTLGAALCAAKLGVPVAHVEAGLRSRDRDMPEEINRLLTDQLADLCFTTCREAGENLLAEGVSPERIRFVGNTMIDTLERLSARTEAGRVLESHSLEPQGFALVTLHRPSNVDEPRQLERVAEILSGLAQRLPVVFPVHARTRLRLEEAGLAKELEATPGLGLCGPLGYLDFLALESAARLVLTDSGGVQEETTVFGVPCLTMRTTTERPVTITEGSNRLVDPDDAGAVLAAVDAVLAQAMPGRGTRPELWDGHAADRIVADVAAWALSRSAS
jgi:UDP-N-acetylglucosamine 2-epimerase (non-hydrolysing)